MCDLTDDTADDTDEEDIEDEDEANDAAAQEFLQEEDEYENNPERIVAINENQQHRETVVEELEGELEENTNNEAMEENANANIETNNAYTT